MSRKVDVHLRDVEVGALVDALIAIELADEHGVYDEEQHRRLTPIVEGFRAASASEPLRVLEQG